MQECVRQGEAGEKAEKHLPRKPSVTAPRETTHQPGAVARAAAALGLVYIDCAAASANRSSVTRRLSASQPADG